jgi:uncharacterized membrane protein YkoI
MNVIRKVVVGIVFSAVALTAAWAEPSESELTKQATVTKSQAEKIALEKVPGGNIKTAEIENEHGKLVWSFDIAKPGTPDITEVLIDAKSGAILTIDKETPEQQAAEAKADKQKH